MKKRKLSMLILAIILSLSMVLPSFATELVIDNQQTEESAVKETTPSAADEQNLAPLEEETEVAPLEEQTETPAATKPLEPSEEAASLGEWTVQDFTFTTMEHSLYGCDYSRQFTIKGPAIAGFSDSGLKKLENNKDLVLPSVNDQGETLIGVADNAFSGKGLTSVVFPEGMSINYDDTVTNGKVTRRGNFMIGAGSFSGNNLTSVIIPEGVIAILPNAFQGNKIETLTLPRTMWWIETLSFSNNKISKINFPKTTDFQLEIHGMAFAKNEIKSVKIPDYCMVIFKYAFLNNPGMEACPKEAPEKEQGYGGVVYLYTDNAALTQVDRIHHIDKTVESQKSWHQKIVYNDNVQIDENDWTVDDFTFDGAMITGLSNSGIKKRALNKNLVLPDWTKDYKPVTGISDTDNVEGGLFGTKEEGFDSVELPNHIERIGDNAFRACNIKNISFPSTLKEIGNTAFQTNNLVSIILPDSVTTVGGGAFATNPTITKIILSKNMKEIAGGTFGCSDATNWMEGLTSIVLPEGLEKIGVNAFAGNNLSEINIPKSVKEIGNYAFSTKNYLKNPCTLNLEKGLEKIGNYAFRNKIISEVQLPSTVIKLSKTAFVKEYSDTTTSLVTKVYVGSHKQYDDKQNFPDSDFHKLYLTLSSQWTAEDFEYEEMSTEVYEGNDIANKKTIKTWAIKGFSSDGEIKLADNKEVVLPNIDPKGQKVTGIAKDAFKKKDIEKITWPEEITVIGYGALRYNKLTDVTLPEGVLWVDTYAFANNEIETAKFPTTLLCIGQASFAQNKIKTIDFPEDGEVKLTILGQAFMSNQIKALQLPLNTEVVNKTAFLANTGNEEITSGTTAEKKGGLVYLYLKDENTSKRVNIAHTENETNKSNVQKLISGEVAEKYKSWNIENFILDENQTTLLGLSDSGKEKLAVNPNVILPSLNKEGTSIIGIGAGKDAQTGIFDYKTGDETYQPSSITLPEKLKVIGKWAFAGSVFSQLTLPQGLENIEMQAFANSSLEKIVLPNSVTSMGMAVFNGSKSLRELILSNNLKSISQAAFVNCPIEELVIPEGVEVIDRMAFNGTAMKKLILPSTLIEIQDQAFYNHQLKELEIPASVKSIGKSAFRVANKTELKPTLEKLVLHEGLESIAESAFDSSNLKFVEIPKTLKVLPKKAFDKSEQRVMLYTSDKEQLKETKDFIIGGTGHQVVYNNLAGSGWSYEDFTFSEDQKIVTGWSDQGNKTRLENKDLVIPATSLEGTTITGIGEKAFKIADKDVEQLNYEVNSPYGMKTVVIPDTVTTIGKQAFEYNNFVQVELPKQLQSVGERAFKGNKLKSIAIPDSLTSLGEGSFSVNALTDIKLPKTLKTITKGSFSMNIRLDHIDIPDTVTLIDDMAFAGARLTSLNIPASVTKIGTKAFHLHHLSELYIPGTVKELGESAFEGTFKGLTLKKLTLGEGIEKIGRYAFKEALLEEVTLPNSLKELGEQPFLNNKGKDGKQVVICNTKQPQHLLWKDSNTHKIHYIGSSWMKEFFNVKDNTLIGLSEIGQAYLKTNKNLSIPADLKVTTIAENAFKDCGITSLILPNTIKTIKEGAFSGNELKKVELPTSIKKIAKTTFAKNQSTVTLTTKDRNLAITHPDKALTGAKVVGPSGRPDLFNDVKDGNWYYDAVAYENARGIMTGLNSTTFGAADKIYRAQFAVVLHRLDGQKQVKYKKIFSDVADKQWYTAAIMWGNSEKIITGYSINDKFGVADGMTREQFILMMYRYTKSQGLDTKKTVSLSKYPDAKNVSDFAKEAMSWGVAEGLISGDKGKLNPGGIANRAETATILMRYMITYDL